MQPYLPPILQEYHCATNWQRDWLIYQSSIRRTKLFSSFGWCCVLKFTTQEHTFAGHFIPWFLTNKILSKEYHLYLNYKLLRFQEWYFWTTNGLTFQASLNLAHELFTNAEFDLANLWMFICLLDLTTKIKVFNFEPMTHVGTAKGQVSFCGGQDTTAKLIIRQEIIYKQRPVNSSECWYITFSLSPNKIQCALKLTGILRFTNDSWSNPCLQTLSPKSGTNMSFLYLLKMGLAFVFCLMASRKLMLDGL